VIALTAAIPEDNTLPQFDFSLPMPEAEASEKAASDNEE
jgi:hypothetical protein